MTMESPTINTDSRPHHCLVKRYVGRVLSFLPRDELMIGGFERTIEKYADWRKRPRHNSTSLKKSFFFLK